MNVGTKSVLGGVHQFLWHPFTVLLAWIELYGLPNWKETVCIFIHDLGYWGKPNMDGKEGEMHPVWAARWAHANLDVWEMNPIPGSCGWGVMQQRSDFLDLCLFHSRTCAKKYKYTPSKLCWADKLSIKYDPWWFYLLRAILSGEIWEYRKDAVSLGGITPWASHREWFKWARGRGMNAAYNRDPTTAYGKLVI